MTRPKLHGDRDRLIPADLRAKVLEYIDDDDILAADESFQRARIGILLADQAGLRAGEIVKLKVGDCRLDRKPHDLLIRGSKHRDADHVDVQPIGPELHQALKGWLAAANTDHDDYVLTRSSAGLSRQWLHKLVKRIHAACELPKIFNVHSWRHGYLTRFYAATKDLVLTSKMARHRSTKPTEKYVHMAEASDEIAKALQGIGSGTKPSKKSPKTPRKKKR